MQFAIKILIGAAAVCAWAAPASAYTINGTGPGGGSVAVDLHKPIPPGGYVKFTLTIPQELSAGIHYSVGFCLGPKMNSCQPGIVVPGGQQIIVFYESAAASTYGKVWLGQGTSAAAPYVLDVEYVAH
jgi:hypothetical protein